MNKKKLIISIVIVAVIIIVLITTLIIQQKIKKSEENNQIVFKEVTAQTQTITKQYSSSLQVATGLDEKIELHATYYFSELLVDTNTFVIEGTKLLEYTNGTYLTAPYDLIITNSSLPASGDECTNSNYLEVQTTETLSADISITESDMQYIKLGEEVKVVLNAFSDKTYTGYITDISETATDSNFTATVTFMNDDNIKLGMSGYCTITLQEAKDVLAVPIETINVRDDNTEYVLVVGDNGIVSEVDVETGISDSNYVEIKSGLNIGQTLQYVDVATGETGNTTSEISNLNNNQKAESMDIVRALNK